MSKKEICIIHNDWKSKGVQKYTDKQIIEIMGITEPVFTGNRYVGFAKGNGYYIPKVMEGIKNYEKARGVSVETILVVSGDASDNTTISYCMKSDNNNKVLSLKKFNPDINVERFGWVRKCPNMRWDTVINFYGTAKEYLNELQMHANEQVTALIEKAESEVQGGYVIRRTFQEWQDLEKLLPKYYGGVTRYIKYAKVLEGFYNLIREPEDNDRDLLELEGHCQRVSKGVNDSEGEIFHPSYMGYKLFVKDGAGNKITYRDLQQSMLLMNTAFKEGYIQFFHKTYREVFNR